MRHGARQGGWRRRACASAACRGGHHCARPRRVSGWLPPTVDWALYATPASRWPRPTLTNRHRARITMPVKVSTARTGRAGPFFDPEERLAVLHESPGRLSCTHEKARFVGGFLCTAEKKAICRESANSGRIFRFLCTPRLATCRRSGGFCQGQKILAVSLWRFLKVGALQHSKSRRTPKGHPFNSIECPWVLECSMGGRPQAPATSKYICALQNRQLRAGTVP